MSGPSNTRPNGDTAGQQSKITAFFKSKMAGSNSIAPAAPNTSSRGFASPLVEAGKITQQEHDTLATLITADMSKAANNNSPPSSVTGHISIGDTATPRHVEVVAAVLETAELLEMILLWVPAGDLILSIPLVCKGIRQAIEASVELKRKAYRLPSTSPSKSLECFSVKVPGFELLVSMSFDNVAELRVRPQDVKEKVRRDARFRAFQVGCPPIKSALYFFQELFDDGRVCLPDSQPEPVEIRSSAGITFGDVLNALEDEWYDMSEYTFFMDTERSGKGQSFLAFEEWVAPSLGLWI